MISSLPYFYSWFFFQDMFYRRKRQTQNQVITCVLLFLSDLSKTNQDIRVVELLRIATFLGP